MLNNWRMAQLHAQEAPERVRELEQWGAMFDRTADGNILQRAFGGHTFKRLCHVGDRTGLGDDSHAAGPRRAHGLRRVHGVHDRAAADGRRALRRRDRILARAGAVRCFQGEIGGDGHRRNWQSLADHLEFLGIHRRWNGAGV